jgi:mannitol/fructose-specific phosphotransferase system IIA component (Ntr-type)
VDALPGHQPVTFSFRSRRISLESIGMNPAPASQFRISELLSPAHVNLRLSGRKRGEVLAELVAAIPELQGRTEDQRTLLDALEEREKLHSTGVGDGVALPHARNALVGLVAQPVIVFGRHDQGIAYGAIDGQPAKLFFLIVAPTVTQHLAALARISRLVRDFQLRQALLRADRPEKVLSSIREAEAQR